MEKRRWIRTRSAVLFVVMPLSLSILVALHRVHRSTTDVSPIGRHTKAEDAALSYRQPLKVLNGSEFIYRNTGDWGLSPVVVEDYKLVFFTTPKVGCTVWNQLFRRIMGFSNWDAQGCCGLLPWNPKTNGLRYLYHYDLQTANRIMTDPTWTRAIFVRDPMERFVSAYLDKAKKEKRFLQRHCCPGCRHLCVAANRSIEDFYNLAVACDDSHWRSQSWKLPTEELWRTINFVGHMESVQHDARELLQRVGAWKAYGQSGWGPNNQSIFSSSTGRKHATNATTRLSEYISDTMWRKLRYSLYLQDYQHPILNLTASPPFLIKS